MGAKKSWGAHEKAAEARERKALAKVEEAARETRRKEDEYWAQHQNPKGRKDAKREDAEARREEAAAKRAEARRLAAEEEASLGAGRAKAVGGAARLGGGGGSGSGRSTPGLGHAGGKVTRKDLEDAREREQRDRAEERRQAALAARREVGEAAYAATLDVENTNASSDGEGHVGLDAALERLGIGSRPGSAMGLDEDRHPERRARAAWEAYFDRELPELKQRKPGLRLMQYKSMIFDAWAKSPENPRNAPSVLGR